MKTGWLLFDGFATNNNGIFTTGRNTHNAPERDVTTFQIAGRNGDFFVDNGRWNNIEVTYPCFVAGFSAQEQYIRNVFGYPLTNYKILQDSYDETHIRLARPVGGIVFEPIRGDFANFELTFDCDPRRFLLSGQDATEIDGSVTITNPTRFEARPLIYIEDVSEGTEISVIDGNGKEYTLTALDNFTGPLEIDSERQDIVAYVDDVPTNMNSLFALPDGFPLLTQHGSQITITGTYGYAEITPRWWEL